MAITSLAVFCGSKPGNNPQFVKQAIALGHLLASKKIPLIYGGGNKGIMGAVSNAVLEKGGKVIGIAFFVQNFFTAVHIIYNY